MPAAERGLQAPDQRQVPSPGGQRLPWASSQCSPRWTRTVPPGAVSRWGRLRPPARPATCPDSQPLGPGGPPSWSTICRPAWPCSRLHQGPREGVRQEPEPGLAGSHQPHLAPPQGRGQWEPGQGTAKGRAAPLARGRPNMKAQGVRGPALSGHPCWQGRDRQPPSRPAPRLSSLLPGWQPLRTPGCCSAGSPNTGPPGPEKEGTPRRDPGQAGAGAETPGAQLLLRGPAANPRPPRHLLRKKPVLK